MADPEFRRQAPLADIDPETIPPESCIDIAIHAKGKTTADIVRAISATAGIATDDPENLVRDLARLPEPLTIVIDALDEAKEPEKIADKILKPITPLATVRLLVGTRKELVPRLGTHVEPKYLDSREYYDPADICDYVKLRLLARDEPDIATPYRDKPYLADKVAEAVAAKAGTVFLIARLICENLIQAKEVVDLESAAWRDALPDTVSAAFGAYLSRFGVDEYRARDLLLPLAYAEGEGLPWDILWAPLASALSGRGYTDQDVAWVRDKAGAYIIEALQSGESVYRLYHQALADYFHNDELDHERHRRIARALIASVPQRKDTKLWQEAHTYVIQHLSTHAAQGGLLPDIVSDTGYLLVADPSRLLPRLVMLRGEAGIIARAYRRASLWRTRHGIEQLLYLNLAFVQEGALAASSKLRKQTETSRWTPVWARWRAAPPYHSLAHGPAQICALDTATLEPDRPVALVGRETGATEIWDLTNGKRLAHWHPDGVEHPRNIALVNTSEGPVLIVAWLRGGIGVFNVTTRDSTIDYDLFVGEEHRVTAMTTEMWNNAPVLVLATRDGQLTVRQLPTLEILHERIDASESSIYALRVFERGSERLLAAGCDSILRDEDRNTSRLRLWSFPDLDPLWRSNPTESGCIQHIEPFCFANQWLLLTSQDFWGPFEMWEVCEEDCGPAASLVLQHVGRGSSTRLIVLWSSAKNSITYYMCASCMSRKMAHSRR